MNIRELALAVVFLAANASSALAGSVRIAERPLVGPFPTLQAAVDAAFEGESLLVAPGTYNSFTIDGKSVQVFVTGTGQATIAGKVTVKNIGATQFAVLSRLVVTGAFPSGIGELALDVSNVQGNVRLLDSTFKGAVSNAIGSPGGGARVTSSVNVVFDTCVISGGYSTQYWAGNPGFAGAIGLDSVNSSIAVYSCTIKGGTGSQESDPGGHGGAGYRGQSFGLFTSGTSFRGGDGGGGDFAGPVQGGAGGDALIISGGQLHALDSTYVGGVGGWSVLGPSGTGLPGGTIVAQQGSIVDLLPGTRRGISTPRIAADDSAVPITITGQPGDRVFLLQARRPSFVFNKPLHGTWMIPTPPFGSWQAVGAIGAGGTLVVNRSFDIRDGTTAARLNWLQALCVDPSGQSTLTGPGHVLALDAASAPDCNANGRQDALDVLFGGSSDCDKNLTPDECDADCNGNGIADACDIASQLSHDSNGNGVPDECEAQFLTLYVDASASAGGNGTQAFPFQSLLPAVNASLPGDTLLLANGVYQGPSNRDISLGGRNITIRSANGPANCTIDCQSAGRALTMTNSEIATIEGITFRGGTATLYGGSIDTQSAHLTLRNCIFRNNVANRGGGAVRVSLGSLRLEGCQFAANSTASTGSFGWGGALYVDRSPLECRDGLFESNQGNIGGAVYIVEATETSIIAHTTFRGNHATFGGAVRDAGGPLGWLLNRYDQCLFAGNTAVTEGGALFLGVSQWIGNSTFVSNSAGTRGGAISFSSGFSNHLDNSLVHGNASPLGAQIFVGPSFAGVNATFSDIQGGQIGVGGTGAGVVWGAGNIDLLPQFTDPDGPDNDPATFDDNDYSLSLGSPCIDAGDNGALAPDLLDIDGDSDTTESVPLDLRHQPRLRDVISVPDTGSGTAPIVDMGCLERQG